MCSRLSSALLLPLLLNGNVCFGSDDSPDIRKLMTAFAIAINR